MTTLEQIRAEIAEIEPLDYPCDKRTPEHIRDMALEIIEKYAEQEPKSPCDLCRFNMDEFCGYLGECPAIEKAVSKCHTV